MEEIILIIFEKYSSIALLISILISIVVAIFGVVPSVFVTTANIVFFGFWIGAFVSFLGEAIGAMIAFLLYRKGFRKISMNVLDRHPKLKTLLFKEGKEAFYLIVSFRLLPFVPSGFVTFISSIGKVSFPIFAIASTVGKIPALVVEVYSVYQVTQWTWQGKTILFIMAAYMFYIALKKRRK